MNNIKQKFTVKICKKKYIYLLQVYMEENETDKKCANVHSINNNVQIILIQNMQ